MSPKEKAKLLGLFLWLFTGLNILVIGIIAIIYTSVIGLVLSQAPHKASDPPPELIVSVVAIVFVFVMIFTILFSIPKIVAGYGLRKQKSWARTWAIIASIMACLSFPIGTAIGVFGLVFLFSDDGKLYFDEMTSGAGQLHAGAYLPQPPPPNSWQ